MELRSEFNLACDKFSIAFNHRGNQLYWGGGGKKDKNNNCTKDRALLRMIIITRMIIIIFLAVTDLFVTFLKFPTSLVQETQTRLFSLMLLFALLTVATTGDA